MSKMDLTKVILSGKEFMKIQIDWKKRLAGNKVSYDEKYETININAYDSGDPYSIKFCECVTPAGVVMWICQLMSKIWCTEDVIHDFIVVLDHACEEHDMVGGLRSIYLK